jgi:hypothetical protein
MPKFKGKEKEHFKPICTKRARLGRLPGSFKLPLDLVKKLKIPYVISELEARSWKCEEKLAEKYFQGAGRIGDLPEQVLAVIIRIMKSISKVPHIKPNLAEYCAAVASQLTTNDSKKKI